MWIGSGAHSFLLKTGKTEIIIHKGNWTTIKATKVPQLAVVRSKGIYITMLLFMPQVHL